MPSYVHYKDYPLVNIQKAIEHVPFIVDLPIKNGDLYIITILDYLLESYDSI